jgi:omega-6 fatty acid desaturase (delta-12 desaturase)
MVFSHLNFYWGFVFCSYNLRKAYAAIEEHWGKYINKAEFGLPLMKTVVSQCNLFDHEKKAWVKFDPLARSQA